MLAVGISRAVNELMLGLISAGRSDRTAPDYPPSVQRHRHPPARASIGIKQPTIPLNIKYINQKVCKCPVVVLRLRVRRGGLRAPGRGEGPRDSGHEMQRRSLRRQTGSVERRLPVPVVGQPGVLLALLVLVHDLLLLHVLVPVLVPLPVVAARSGAAPVLRGALEERRSGGRIGDSRGQGAAHRRLVVAESQRLLVDLGLHHGAQVLLRLRLSELLLQGEPRRLLPLQVLHDGLELHAAAGRLLALGSGERAVRGGGGRSLERKAAGGRERALLRGGGSERTAGNGYHFSRFGGYTRVINHAAPVRMRSVSRESPSVLGALRIQHPDM
ncbi:hypothetical protein EYF80_048330 [Liparis tanakae]|uniref:Uncharacterized protein n=1 Tax=Liparis tanakae TaxID=230148 RepID=A0A4Z2FKH6_9TELE|nr:hypothetical protein EYF80_048330 [Liparis tanakae]